MRRQRGGESEVRVKGEVEEEGEEGGKGGESFNR